jgi:hypothetical protein
MAPKRNALAADRMTADGGTESQNSPGNAGNNQPDAAIADVMEQLETVRTLPLKSAPPYPTQVGK